MGVSHVFKNCTNGTKSHKASPDDHKFVLNVFFSLRKILFWVLGETILISCEFKLFSYLKFVALLIKITPSIIKLHCGTKFSESLAVQSVSCFKKVKVFNS